MASFHNTHVVSASATPLQARHFRFGVPEGKREQLSHNPQHVAKPVYGPCMGSMGIKLKRVKVNCQEED